MTLDRLSEQMTKLASTVENGAISHAFIEGFVMTAEPSRVNISRGLENSWGAES